MENLSNLLLSLLDPLAVDGVSVLPLVITAIVVIATALIQRNFRAPMLAGVVTYTVSNIALFAYILFQPMRPENNPWLEGVTYEDIPEVGSAPELNSSNPLTDGLVDSFNGLFETFNRITGWMNTTGSTLEEKINLFNAYSHTFALASPYLKNALLGLLASLIVLLLYAVMKKFANARERRMRDRRMWQLENQLAYMFGREQQGHDAYSGYPYNPRFNFTQENGYAIYVDLVDEERRRRGEISHQEVTEYQ